MSDKLAYAALKVPVAEAPALIEAFCRPFPSLGGVSGAAVVRSVCTTYHLHRAGDQHFTPIRAEIKAAVDEASMNGEWPAQVRWADVGTWTPRWAVTLSPYVGDRHITIEGGMIGRGHGKETQVSIVIDCLERPSAEAMSSVIEWLASHPDHATVIAWSEGVRHVDAWREEEAAKDWVADLEAAFIVRQQQA